MKCLIAVPCMDTVDTMFSNCLLSLKKPEGTMIQFQSSSLVYDSRNKLADVAVEQGFTHIMWFDSDMVFESDTMMRLLEDLDEGHDIVTGLAFARRPPFTPCIYKKLRIGLAADEIETEHYLDYPKNELFEVEGCGCACCAMKVDVFRKMREEDNELQPFSPIYPFGEDLSMCLRARRKGFKIFCDSRIRVGHVARTIVTEQQFLQYAEYERIRNNGSNTDRS